MLLDFLRKRSPRAAHLRAGIWGERQAERWLRKKGYRILGRRVRMGRRDELDLVARDGEVLVFVEVKTRRTEAFGRPLDFVNLKKRRAVGRAARQYLRKLKSSPPYFRFDVVEVIGEVESDRVVVRHIENAFRLPASFMT